MTELDPNSGWGKQAWERNQQTLATLNWVWKLMLLYLFTVILNALSIVVVFWLYLLHIGHFAQIPPEFLAAWAVGSGGLGAGTFIFKVPLAKLFTGPLWP